jgi:hypothetical protein
MLYINEINSLSNMEIRKKKTHAALFSEASENTFRIADSRCNLLFEFLLFSISRVAARHCLPKTLLKVKKCKLQDDTAWAPLAVDRVTAPSLRLYP